MSFQRKEYPNYSYRCIADIIHAAAVRVQEPQEKMKPTDWDLPRINVTASVVRSKSITQAQRRGILTSSMIWKRFVVLVDHQLIVMTLASLKRQPEPHLRFSVQGDVLFTAKLPSPTPHHHIHWTTAIIFHPCPRPLQSKQSTVIFSVQMKFGH